MLRTNYADYRVFFLEEYAKVVAFLCKLGFGFDHAEDAVQEAMIAALKQWPLPEERRKGWIRTAAKRIAVREAKRERDELPRLVAKGYGVDPHDGTESQRLVDQRDGFLVLLGHLSSAEREVVSWRLDGFNATEIAEEMGFSSPGVARVCFNRAKKKIVRLLEAGSTCDGGAR